MTEQTHHIVQLDNGFTLIVEPMQSVRSASFSFLVPAGSVYDPVEKNGTASILADLITRGAGNKNSRELSLALDTLGLQRSERGGSVHLSFSGATLGDNIPQALKLYRDILRSPHLPPRSISSSTSGGNSSITLK